LTFFGGAFDADLSCFGGATDFAGLSFPSFASLASFSAARVRSAFSRSSFSDAAFAAAFAFACLSA
jgi:hypothetical protein